MSESRTMENALRSVKGGINWTLGWLAALLLITMTFLVVYQVFTRYVLSSPAAWTEEIVRYILIWTGFVAGAYAFGTRQHMAFLFVRDRFKGKSSKTLLVLIDGLVLAFALLVIVIGGTRLALSALPELSALLGISRGLVYGVAPVAGVFIVVIQLINIWEDITGIELLKEKKDDIEEEELGL